MDSSNWVVQKFGGTSVGKFPRDIVEHIIKFYTNDQNNNVAVVCSARSSYTKSEGTTTRLLKCCDLASQEEEFMHLIEEVRQDHVSNAEANIENPALQTRLISDSNKELDLVVKYLEASKVLGEVSPRTMDLVMACGEKLSCLFIASLCNDRGCKAQYVDLSHIVPSDFTTNNLDTSFYAFLVQAFKEKLQPVVQARERIVPVITGFFGLLPMGLLNGVGRGYTDLCAALIAVALNSEELQVWKEVDGIFTADPRKVPQARLLSSVTPEEAAELTYYGSEVIHPFTMEQVIRAKIPIRIKNVQNPRGDGTIIYPDNVAKKGESTPPHPPETLTASFFEKRRRGATAITAKSDIVVLNIHSNKKTLSHGFLAQIFTILDKYKLVVDLICTSEVHVSMALPIPDSASHKALRQAVEKLQILGSVDITKKMAIVSLIGKQMKQYIGIAGTMFTTLAEENINIEMISQGANEINISAVIEETDAIKALQSIHAKLLDESAPEKYFEHAVDERLEQIKRLEL
ncbi:BN860_01662g1_1 [Zygosaccharomyces bailii CLIB 213]|uniref:Aspartokinase n=1 Tax=Zygosaccharomyces bailii (strain CLIB 213 / ATCC 58445 / CBS 680 / BCRC 21525 / NBRC 1098 / NCYC 1416 / NRRL Y-2227) TaxID=1333698 RepID=A0A8J2T1X3_ZYGB2|nr:BN860_01662g1_1 [Zygosaccharomyces bailii CLIB 213]